MKAADYVLVPDIANQNRNADRTNIGGMLGGLLPHGIGAVVGGVSLKSKTADVVLTLTDVRSTEQVALEQGHAKKTDLGWMGGGGGAFFGGFAAGGASSYANTEIGQVVTMAYLDAYIKMVNEFEEQRPGCQGRQRAAGDQGSQTREALHGFEFEIQGGARFGSRHDAVSHRRQDGRVVESHRRTRQRGLGGIHQF